MLILVIVTFSLSMLVIIPLGLYPAYAWIRSVFLRKEVKRSDDFIHPVSIVIAAHNEEKFIRQKLDSFLDPEEWIEGSEIIVVSNGSTDATNSILTEYAGLPGMKIILKPEKASKILSVNRGVKEAKHELLVFSDCRQLMERGSVKSLVRNFNDPGVGTVNSTLTDAGREKKFSFRSFLTQISHWESLSGSSLNVFGALYAQRKSVFREFPEDMLFDDLYVVVSTILQKKRLITESKAVIYDVPFSDYYVQDRINRLARGLLIFLFNHFKMISRLPLNYFFRFIIFKYLKLILPIVLIFLLLDAVYLCWHFIPLNITLMYLVASVLLLNIKSLRKFIIHFLRINYYFLIATLQFIFFNKRSNKWGKLKV